MADDIEKTADDEFSAGFDAADAALAGTADDGPEPTQKPTDEPTEAQPAQSDDTADANADAPAEEPAPWEHIPEQFRGEFVQLAQRAANFEHSFRSEQERSVGQQRRAQEMEARLAELEKSQPSPTAESAPGPADANMEALDASLPEVADEIRALRQANEQLRAEIDRRVGPVEQTSQALNASQQEAALEAAHPDWRAVASTTEFNAAMARAPKLIREAFEQNSAAIKDAENAALVIGWYKGQNGAAIAPSPQKPNQAEQVKQKRTSTLQSAVAPAVRDSVIPQADDSGADDFDAGWAAADRDIRQHRI